MPYAQKGICTVAYGASAVKASNGDWIIDSGASKHLTPHRQHLHNHRSVAPNSAVTFVNGHQAAAVGQGKVTLRVQWELHFAQTSAAVHLSRLTAHLYEQQISIGLVAVTQACCEPVLQSNTEQWGLHFAQNSVAVHLSWLTAHLSEQQISIGVIAVTQACCEPVLHSNTEQWELHFAQTRAAVHFCWLTAHLYELLYWRFFPKEAEAPGDAKGEAGIADQFIAYINKETHLMTVSTPCCCLMYSTSAAIRFVQEDLHGTCRTCHNQVSNVCSM